MQGCDPAVLAQVIKDAGLRHGNTSISYVFDCPKCGGKKKLYIRKRDGRFVCWVCKETENYQGRPEYALADLLGVPVKVISSKLYGGSHVPVELYLDVRIDDFFGDDDEVDEDATELPSLFWPLDYYPIEDAHAARGAAYLEGRGISATMAAVYDIHYAPIERRVVFPVAAGGELYGWQGRLVVPHEYVDEAGILQKGLKIKGSTGLPRERLVMFADRLKGLEHAVLGEGPVDAIKAHYFGGNVSPMGKAVSPEQVRLLLRAGVKKLYLGLDPDAADEVMRLVRDNFDDVELYQLVASVHGAKEKADLGAMTFDEVTDLCRGAEKVKAGQIFVYFDPRVGA